jgi:hypothetical protein
LQFSNFFFFFHTTNLSRDTWSYFDLLLLPGIVVQAHFLVVLFFAAEIRV